MVREIVCGTTEWFKSVIGLYGQGLDIMRELNDYHVLVTKCETLWGPRQSKNGFKLCHSNDLTIDVKIHKLWPLVYQKAKIANNFIFLTFAKGVFVENKGHKVNWVKYVDQAQSMGGKSHKTNTITYSGHT
jgi:hypothetical protein